MTPRLQPLPDANPRFQRVAARLFGCYRLESRREFPCQTIEISPEDITLFAPVKAVVGEKVVVCLDEIGRFAGVAVRQTETGFVMAMDLAPAKRDKLAAQLTWFASGHVLDPPEDHRNERVIPLVRRSILRLPDGREVVVRIRDISLSDVDVDTDVCPPLGSHIVIGATRAVVARHFESGIGAEFDHPFAPGEIDESTRL